MDLNEKESNILYNGFYILVDICMKFDKVESLIVFSNKDPFYFPCVEMI